ncbi:MAG: hypothetical protein GF353_11245 [Candidatus Lokiarchaeota archaeon]|nr:hypothetical protein [Candidatus Lokiarchaeota archaeon]
MSKRSRKKRLEEYLERIVFDERSLSELKNAISSLKGRTCDENDAKRLKELIFSQRMEMYRKMLEFVDYYQATFAKKRAPDREQQKKMEDIRSELKEKDGLLEDLAVRVGKIWEAAFGPGSGSKKKAAET